MPTDFRITVLLVKHLIKFWEKPADFIFLAERNNRAFVFVQVESCAAQNQAISLNVMFLERIFAVGHVGVADDEIALADRVFVIADDVTAALGKNIKQLQNVGVAVEHVRMIAAVVSVDENNIRELNLVHDFTSENILADKIFARYNFLIKFRRRKKIFGGEL